MKVEFGKITIASIALLASICIHPVWTNADDVSPTTGKIVFQEDFNDLQVGKGKKWGWQSSSYETCTSNPKNGKLDKLTTRSMKVTDGVLNIQAAPDKDGYYWDTGLLTTGDSCSSGGNQFLVKPGDFMLIHVKLPTGNVGAWPGFWTWKDGRNEIDAFEWHSNNPHLLEFNNHVNEAGHYYTDEKLIDAGKWVFIGVKLGIDNNTWYVGSNKEDLQAVWSDQKGVGKSWSAYMIANLSVDSDSRAPKGDQPIDFSIDSIEVYR